jgi:hypothetical protein
LIVFSLYCGLAVCWHCRAFAADSDAGTTQEIIEVFSAHKKAYLIALRDGDFVEARRCAMEMLAIDPADAMSYMRLSLAAHAIGDVDFVNFVIREYGHEASLGTPAERDIVDIANALLESVAGQRR